MGHYVPREYLRAFGAVGRSDHIWMMSRGQTEPKLLPIEVVAQAPRYYPEATESLLNTWVEGPAHSVLRKLRQSVQIDEAERLVLARYIAALIRRVPRARERALSLVPEVVDDVLAEFVERMDAGVAAGVLSDDGYKKGLGLVEGWRTTYKAVLPPDLRESILDPLPSDRLIAAVNDFAWRIIIAPPNEYFITTDNPAFYPESVGMSNETAELRFPLSPTHALHGSHRPTGVSALSFIPVRRECVREYNRSLASTSTKLVFSHKKSPWIQTLMDRQQPYLSRFVWTT